MQCTEEYSRQEIIDYILDTGLAETCLRYQTNKCTNKYLKEELRQELWLWLLTYDIEKLQDAYENKHLNALVTRWLQNNFHSKTSPFYKQFRKFDLLSDEIGQKELNIPEV